MSPPGAPAAGGAASAWREAGAAAHVTEFSEADLVEAFAIERARAVLLVGSRVTGSDRPGSDVDFLAIFEDPGELPAAVPLPGAVSMPHSLGENWIGAIGAQEANVEAVSAATIRRVAALVDRPLDERRAPLVQPLELRLLDRLRRNVVVRGGGYVRALGVDSALARLPMVAVVMRYCGVRSNLPVMRQRLEDGDGTALALLVAVMAAALGQAATSLHGTIDAAWRRVVPALRALEREGADLPVTASDLQTMLAAPGDRRALGEVAAALDRVRAAVEDRARSDPLWAEALRGLEAQG